MWHVTDLISEKLEPMKTSRYILETTLEIFAVCDYYLDVANQKRVCYANSSAQSILSHSFTTPRVGKSGLETH